MIFKKIEQKPIIIFFLSFLFLFPALLSAKDEKKILIVNSDSKVEKYKEVQDEFKNTVLSPVSEIDLGEEKWSISELESKLSDKSADIIYCIGSKAYLIASKYGADKDIIFSSIINWLRLPITPKTYGISNELNTEMQIMLVRLIFPNIKRIGVLYSRQYNQEWFMKTLQESETIGVKIIGRAVSDKNNAVSLLKEILSESDIFWLISDPAIMSEKNTFFEVLKICDNFKVPVFSYNDIFAKYGVILSVSADNLTIGRQAAGIAAELLEKNRKINEKVQFPAGTHITLNLKKIKEYGLKYSEDALGSVNNIIE